MSKMKSNNVNNLIKLKDAFNELISERIIDAKNDKAKENINECNIGELKFLFETISNKLYDLKEGKKVIKNYVNCIKSNKDLSNFYTLFESVKNAKNVSNSSTLINESLSLSKRISKKSLKELSNILKEGVNVLKMNDDELNTILDNYKNSIDCPLSYVLTENKTKSNLVEYSNNISKICENIEHKKVTEDVNTSDTLDDIKNIMDECSDTDKDLIKDITLFTLSGKGKKGLFETYKNKCVDTLNETLDNCETVQDKNRFQTMLEHINNKNFSEENFVEDIIKLNELNKTLKEN